MFESELEKAILALTAEVKELKEILKPELSETSTLKRLEENQTQVWLESIEFAEKFDA